MKHIKFVIAILVLATEVTAAPATRPAEVYDRFTDRTTLAVELGPVVVSYGFNGKSQSGIQENVTIAVSRPGGSLIFLVDDQRREVIAFELGQSKTVPVELLKELADAKKLEFAILSDARTEVRVSDEQIQQLRALLDQTRYYSAQAVEARRHASDAIAKAIADRAEEQAKNDAEERRRTDEQNAEAKRQREFFSPDGRIVYIVDLRGRMYDGQKAAQTTCKESIKMLGAGQPFQILAISNYKTVAYPDAMQPATELTKQEACKFVDGIAAEGPGDVAEAFQKATALKPGTIVLVAGGEIGMTTEDMEAIRRTLLGSGVKLHVVLVGRADADKELTSVVKDVKGSVRHVPDKWDH